jgi:hypothetical protein
VREVHGSTATKPPALEVGIVLRDVSPEVQLRKRAGTSIKDAVHYVKKADKWDRKAADRWGRTSEENKKKDANLMKQYAMKSNDPRYAEHVVRYYDARLKALEGMKALHEIAYGPMKPQRPGSHEERMADRVISNLERQKAAERIKASGITFNPAKEQHWKDMRDLWEQKRITQAEEKQKAEKDGTFKFWDKESQRAVNTYIREKNGWAPRPEKEHEGTSTAAPPHNS